MLRTIATSAVLITLITTGAFADSYKRIKFEADFRAQVVGKTITFDGGTAVINADGTTNGTITGKGAYYGAWQWNNGYYCRNLVIEGSETGTNCLKVETTGDMVRMTYDQGKGRVIEARMN